MEKSSNVEKCQLLQGKVLAKEIQEKIKAMIVKLQTEGLEVPGLLALQVSDDSSATWYINQQEKWASKLGIHFERLGPKDLPGQAALIKVLRSYKGKSEKIHGIFLAQPLPAPFNIEEALHELDPRKDVEGVHPASLGLIVLRRSNLIPPTAFAAYRLIESTGVELRGKRAVIVGQSAIVGRPVNMLLGERRVTTAICNTGTTPEHLEQIVSESDIVVACAGSPGMIKGGWIKQDAIVIDVGTTEVDGKLTGDVEFEEAAKRAKFITPVPGGVGPLTVTMLMQNLITAYKWQKGI